METVQGGYRGKLKKENEDDDVAGDGERDIEDWINGDRRGGRTIHATAAAAADGQGGFWARYPGCSLFSSFGRAKTASDSVLSHKQERVEACTVNSTVLGGRCAIVKRGPCDRHAKGEFKSRRPEVQRINGESKKNQYMNKTYKRTK